MNRNHLKLIACVSMLLDHIGVLLFPGAVWLRWAGRLALPLFAFFIGEGCRYTKNRKKYFLTVFFLGVACQAVYAADALIEWGPRGLAHDAAYLNILLTFSVSIPLGYLTRDLCAAAAGKNAPGVKKNALLLAAGLALLAGGAAAFAAARAHGIWLMLDYGVPGVLLPLCALPFEKKETKLLSFSLGTLAFCALTARDMPYIWFSLLAPALLLFYNGKSGSKKFKYAFYAFYPAHLAALYLIQQIFF